MIANQSALTGPTLSAAKPTRMRPTAAEMFRTVSGSAESYSERERGGFKG